MLKNIDLFNIIDGKKKSLYRKFLDNYYSLKTKKEIVNIIHTCNNYNFNTSTIYDLWINYFSLKRIINNSVKGDIVECGVWKGISLVFFQKILNFYKIEEKKIYGYDTFEGFPEPSEKDITIENIPMRQRYENSKLKNDSSNWNYCSLEDVKKNFQINQIETKNLELIKGKVENTLQNKKNIPKQISILKLDTCLYDSTKIELEILFSRLQTGGILIVDNYANYYGVRDAVKEFFINKNFKLKFDKLSGQIIVNK